MDIINQQKLDSQILNLANMVNYQEMSIVSKQIINKQAGSITLFAFDEGQSLSEHTTLHDALVYILDGETQINISGISYYLKQNEAIIMPANVPHSVKALKKFKMMLVMIK